MRKDNDSKNRYRSWFVRVSMKDLSILLISVVISLFTSASNAESGSISAGRNHSLVVNSEGEVWAFGFNHRGQLGDASILDSQVPVKAGQGIGFGGVNKVSAGDSFSLALKSNGEVWAWGLNDYGQLGDGTTTNRSTPVRVGESIGMNDIIAISAGSGHALAVKSNGEVWAWGRNGGGQLGDGTVTSRLTPVQVGVAVGFAGATEVSAGEDHSLILKANGEIWACGSNWAGQLGDGTTISKTTPVRVGLSINLAGVTAVAAGSGFSLALKADTGVLAWGSNYSGQLGDGGEFEYASTPKEVWYVSEIVEISAGTRHALALDSYGMVWTWGDDSINEMDSDWRVRWEPIVIDGSEEIVEIAAGGHSLSVNLSGSLNGWGGNTSGQLGDQNAKNRLLPLQSPVAGTNILKGAGGYSSGSLIKPDGIVRTWGYNEVYQLADGTNQDQGLLSAALGLTQVTAVARGEYHGLALKANGQVWAWGYNNGGQAGAGSGSLYQPTPIRVGASSNFNGVSGIAAGSSFSVAVKSNGEVWIWGMGADGTTTFRSNPAKVVTLSGVVSVAAGSGHWLALKGNGEVWAWGYNFNGEYGDGTTVSKVAPVRVGQSMDFKDVIAIAAGGGFSLALKQNGEVWAWGRNDNGQLGDGTVTARTTPVRVGLADDFGGVSAIASGWGHCLARKSNGEIWAWGLNSEGQLGIGSKISSSNPVSMSGLNAGPDGSIFACYHSSHIIKEDGRLLAVGSGYYGQLMNGWTYGYFPYPRWIAGVNTQFKTPTVTLSSASNAVSVGTSIEINAAVSVANGTIAGVYFYKDGIQIGSDSTVPFTLNYTPSTWGDTEIHAIAFTYNGSYSASSNRLHLSIPYDGDFDSLPDWKEIQYFGTLENAGDDDTDEDGLNNLGEINQKSNPAVADTDNDGMPDGWEYLYRAGLNLLVNDAAGNPDSDGFNNIAEFRNGTDPLVPDIVVLPDVDLDGQPDEFDVDPNDPDLNWSRAGKIQYTLVEISDGSGLNQLASDLNDNGDILFPSGFWSKGQWTSLPVGPPIVDTVQGVGGTHHYITSNFDWTDFNDSRQAIGAAEMIASFGGGEIETLTAVMKSPNGAVEDLAALIPYSNYSLAGTRAIGITSAGKRIVHFQHDEDINPDPAVKVLIRRSKLVEIQPGMAPVLRTPPGNVQLFDSSHIDLDSRVSPSGWVIMGTRKQLPNDEYEWGSALWNPSGALVDLPEEADVYAYRQNITEFKNGNVLVALVCGDGSSRVFLKKNGNFQYIPSLSNKKIEIFAGDGIGLTNDDKIWINNNLITIGSVCPAYQELLNSGYFIVPVKANSEGGFLLHAFGPQGELKSLFMIPSEVISPVVQVDAWGRGGKPMDEIKIPKMVSNVITGNVDEYKDVQNPVVNPDADIDRFYIRVRGGKDLGEIRVKIGSVDCANDTSNDPNHSTLTFDYNDDPTEIILPPIVNGYAFSKSMIMVSDVADDTHVIDGVADNGVNDRSHIVQLGGSVHISQIKVGNGAWSNLGLKIPVKVKKVATVDAYIVKTSNGDPEVVPWDHKVVNSYMNVARERFAQIGVELRWNYPNIPVVDCPEGVTLSDGLQAYLPQNPKRLAPEGVAFLTALGTAGNTNDVKIFFIENVYNAGQLLRGLAITTYWAHQDDLDYTYNCFASKGGSTMFTPGHELVHLLANEGHTDVPLQLMRDGGTSHMNLMGSSKRLYLSQEIKIQSNPRVGNPE